MSVDLKSSAGINGTIPTEGRDVSGLREDVASVKQDIQKVLDNQALLVALFKEGALLGVACGPGGWICVLVSSRLFARPLA